MIDLYRDPSGDNILTTTLKETGSDSLKCEQMDVVISLKKRITELEEMLGKLPNDVLSKLSMHAEN